MSVWSALFSLRPSARCLAASASSRLPARLRTGSKSGCQGLLTVGIETGGGVLERGDRRVRLEKVSHDLRAFHLERVVAEAANEGQIAVSGAADTFAKGEHAHLSLTSTEFCFRSNVSRMASPTLRPLYEKSASVWSGLTPQRVVSCGLPLATSTTTLAPSSPMSFRSKL